MPNHSMNATYSLMFLFLAAGGSCLSGQQPPPILAPPLKADRPFPGWEQLKGRIVVIDYWGTWCSPCLPGLEKLRGLEKQFQGKPVTFLTVARDEPDRVRRYFAEKGLDLTTFAEDDGRTVAAWGIFGYPVVGIVLADGTLLGTTPGENLTAGLLEKLLSGERPKLPSIVRGPNEAWDRDEVEWRDGVRPDFYVIIKPVAPGGVGILYPPGSNRISGDGAKLVNLLTLAWQTEPVLLDLKLKAVPDTQYRFAAMVPLGRDSTLLPMLQEAIQRYFAIRVEWQDQERDVLVLKSSKALERSSNPEFHTSMQGAMTLKGQPMAKLAAELTNSVRKIVVDETGLDGRYDFLLSYRSDSPDFLANDLRTKYGLTLEPARRRVRVLAVTPDN